MQRGAFGPDAAHFCVGVQGIGFAPGMSVAQAARAGHGPGSGRSHVPEQRSSAGPRGVPPRADSAGSAARGRATWWCM